MSNLLLSDPLLRLLEPKDLVGISHLNKECLRFIKEYQQTKTTYDTRLGKSESYKVRQHLYSLYPKIQTLTFEYTHLESIQEYLRPTIQTIHLILPLSLSFPGPSEDGTLEWFNIKSILKPLQEIQTYLKTPNCQLQQLSISFSKCVCLSVTVENGLFTRYDRFGPVYEDYDRNVWSTVQDASYFLPFIDDYYTMDMKKALDSLELSHIWKEFSVPCYFTNPHMMDPVLLQEIEDLLQNECC
jgi:hypothetical protein